MTKSESYLFVLPWSLVHPGGVNQVVINLAMEMQNARSFAPIVFIQDWSATDPEWGEFQGLRTVRWRIRRYRAGMHAKEWLAYHLWELRFTSTFARFCETHRVAAVNIHYVGDTAFTFDRIIKKGKTSPAAPLILSFHGQDFRIIATEPSDQRDDWRRLLAQVSVVAPSEDLAMQISTFFGKEIVPVTIHNGINATRFTGLPGNEPMPARRFILNVGKFEARKGQEFLIEAFAQIADAYADLHLVLLGATDVNLQGLMKTVNSRGLDHRVHFFLDMPHERVSAFFKAAALFVLPSTDESFGIVVLEAGVFAIPVVASRVGGVPEIIRDRETGRLVTPGDADELARVLRSMLDDSETAQAMGSRLQQHVLENFTWRAAHNKYLAVAKERNTQTLTSS